MKNNILVIGIIATDGAGKTSVAQRLAQYPDTTHHSVRNFLFETFKKNTNREATQPSEITTFANELRVKRGVYALIEGIITQILNTRKGVHVIESIRCPGEIEYLKTLHGIASSKHLALTVRLIGIDAPAEQRFERLKKRGDYKAPKTFEEFLRNEAAEWEHPDPLKQNIKKCLEMIPPSALFQNPDGMFDIVMEKVYRYSIAT